MISRRNLLVAALKGGAYLLTPVAVLKGIALGQAKPGATRRSPAAAPGQGSGTPAPENAIPDKPKKLWGFLIDTTKCVGCGFCVTACKRENEVPFDANVSRTWIERYVVTRDGKVHADSPKAGRDGFTSDQIDVGPGERESIEAKDIGKAFFVPKMCNQCSNPPCVQVCPVGATYQTEDGVILIDRKTCIGCGYCIMACPYGARFFHPVHKTAEKCTFCYHRISVGLEPACVQACPFEARQFGDLNNPDDPVTKAILTERVNVLKDEYGTKPKVHYIGLSKEVR